MFRDTEEDFLRYLLFDDQEKQLDYYKYENNNNNNNNNNYNNINSMVSVNNIDDHFHHHPLFDNSHLSENNANRFNRKSSDFENQQQLETNQNIAQTNIHSEQIYPRYEHNSSYYQTDETLKQLSRNQADFRLQSIDPRNIQGDILNQENMKHIYAYPNQNEHTNIQQDSFDQSHSLNQTEKNTVFIPNLQNQPRLCDSIQIYKEYDPFYLNQQVFVNNQLSSDNLELLAQYNEKLPKLEDIEGEEQNQLCQYQFPQLSDNQPILNESNGVMGNQNTLSRNRNAYFYNQEHINNPYPFQGNSFTETDYFHSGPSYFEPQENNFYSQQVNHEANQGINNQQQTRIQENDTSQGNPEQQQVMQMQKPLQMQNKQSSQDAYSMNKRNQECNYQLIYPQLELANSQQEGFGEIKLQKRRSSKLPPVYLNKKLSSNENQEKKHERKYQKMENPALNVFKNDMTIDSELLKQQIKEEEQYSDLNKYLIGNECNLEGRGEEEGQYHYGQHEEENDCGREDRNDGKADDIAILADSIKHCNKKNVVKNIMSAFLTFMNDKEHKIYTEEEQECIPALYHSVSKDEDDKLEEIRKKFKRYIIQKSLNHYTVRLLILHPNYGPIFRHYLTNPIKKWINNSKVADLGAHIKMIGFFLACFQDSNVLEELKRHEKKRAHFS